MKFKIGQKIVMTNSFHIDSVRGKVKVNKGDIATVIKKVDKGTGEIVYTTGEATGLSQIVPIEVDDSLDSDYIAKRIMEEL